MSIARTIHRTAKFAAQNFWRNIWLSIATVVIFLLTLMTVNILLTMNVLTNAAVESVEDRIDVAVYFEPGTSEQLILSAEDYLEGLSQVASVEYVSQEEAFTRFSERHKNNPDILAALQTVEVNPFGGSLIVRATSPEEFDFILEALNNPTFGEAIKQKDFSDHERLIEKINSFTSRIRLFAMALALIFGLIALLIVFNTVRVAIYTHREEIGIMKLVGANNGFIRLPFFLEAIFFSLIATLVMALIAYPLIHVVEPQLNLFFDGSSVGLNAYYVQYWWAIFGLQFLGLSFLSLLSTGLAMNRYLKV